MRRRPVAERAGHGSAVTRALGVVLGMARAALLATAGVRPRRPVRATIGPDGCQEATITVNGRYHPNVIQVIQGVPVRLHFVRQEDDPCSERVIFAGFGVDRRLTSFQKTTVELVPTAPGTFLFTCQWGMYRGKLIVGARDRQ